MIDSLNNKITLQYEKFLFDILYCRDSWNKDDLIQLVVENENERYTCT